MGRLLINYGHGDVSIASTTHTTIEPGRRYRLGGGYEFLVRLIGGTFKKDALTVEITSGSKVVKDATVDFRLRANDGRYEVNLDPQQPLYPVDHATYALLSYGIPSHMITLSFGGSVTTDWLASPAENRMRVVQPHGEAVAEFQPGASEARESVRFVVLRDNPWAVVHTEKGVVMGVFLSPAAGDGDNVKQLMAAIRRIES